VSSQAWKRAVRVAFADELDQSDLGVRTKRVVERVANEIVSIDASVSPDEALAAAEKVLKAASIALKEPRGKKDAPLESGYLLFLSAQQVRALAQVAIEALVAGTEPDKKEAQALIKNKNSIDLALFGRMVADVSDLNVDACCQVAHAISTHGVETEYDYFTAVDDHKAEQTDEDAGAGMIGTVEFNSATLYRYATVDVDLLQSNLGDAEATGRGLAAFLHSFAKSMPTGKQNTFANRTLPDVVLISVRCDQSVSFVGAFEQPVDDAKGSGFAVASAKRLAQHACDLSAAYGMAPVKTWVTGVGGAGDAVSELGEKTVFDAAVEQATAFALSRLSDGQP